MNKVSKRIMRRVYYIYAVRALGGVQTLRALVMGACVLGLLQFVSIVNVVANVSRLSSPLQLEQFILSAVTHTEVWTLLSLAILAATAPFFIKAFTQPRGYQFAS